MASPHTSVLATLAALAATAGGCSREGRAPAANANFSTGSDTFALRIRVSGNGAVVPGGLGPACSDDCTFRALRGKTVELRAIERGDVFHRWRGFCGRAHSCAVKMTRDLDVGAEFGLDRYEPAWAVPLTSSQCVDLTDLSVRDRVVAAGSFDGTATFGRSSMTSHGDYDAFLAALHPQSGEVDWTVHLGGKGTDRATAAALLVSGHVLATLSIADGATLGSSKVTGQQELISWIDVDDGTLTSSAPLSGPVNVVRPLDQGGAVVAADRGRNATRIARFSSIGGSPSWSNDLAASVSVLVREVASGPSGDVFVIGTIQGMPRFGGLVASASPRDRRPFLARLDGVSGSVRHARWLDLEPSHFVKRMASDGRQLIVTGATGEPPGQAFVLAMSFEGHTRWRRYYHALDKESTVSIHPVVASQGGAVVAGDVEGELALADRTIGRRRQTTFFLLELSPEGDEVWSFALPPKAGIVRALARDADGDLYLAGWFRLPFKFAGKTVAPQPSSECTGVYLAKLVRTGDRSPRPPAPP